MALTAQEEKEGVKEPVNTFDVTTMVRQFARVFGQPYAVDIAHPGSLNLQTLRIDMITEEFNEFKQEVDKLFWQQPDARAKAALLKELADLVYVIYGFAVAFGLPLDRAIELVHENNMSKRQPDGSVKYRDDGKVLKPDSYKPVNLEVLF